MPRTSSSSPPYKHRSTAGLDVQLTKQPNKQGRITLVIQAIQAIIGSADALLQPVPVHVLPNWKTPIPYLIDNYPVVTLRVGNEDDTEKIYGRQMAGNQRGMFVMYPFTAHVWGEKTWQLFEDVDDENEAIPQVRTAADIADNIVDALLTFTGDSTSGIVHFTHVMARESEPDRGPKRLTRMIITGMVLVRRTLGAPLPTVSGGEVFVVEGAGSETSGGTPNTQEGGGFNVPD